MENIIQKVFKNVKKDDANIWIESSDSTISYRENGHNFINKVESDSFWYIHRNQCVIEKIKSLQCKWILDVGGGNGSLSQQLEKDGILSIVLEPGRDGVLNASKKGIKYIVQSDFIKSEINNNIVENFVLCDVLEHIEKDKEFLIKVFEKLTSKGYLFITVPAYSFLWSKNDEEVGHYRRYSLKKLSNIIEEAGFNIKYKTYLFWFLPLPILFFRKIFYKNKIADKKQFEHATKSKIASNFLSFLLKFEKKAVLNNIKIPFGSTCFICAKK